LLWRLTPSWIRAYGKRVARNHRRSERGMTGSFRDWSHSVHGVRFVILYVLGYLGLSVVAFSCLLEPSWTMIDSLYFAVATFTSVGYGDLSPSTAAGKVFTVFLSLYGISILGIAVGIIGANVSEVQDAAMEEVRQRASKRLFKLLDKYTMASASVSLTTGDLAQSSTPQAPSGQDSEEDRHIAHHIASILLSQLPLLSTMLAITMCLGRKYEGWSTLTSTYYFWITLTTVGYGDFAPRSQQMRLYAVFFLPLWVAVDGEILGRVAAAFVRRRERRAERRFLARKLTARDLRVMDTHGTGDVSFDEFLAYALVAMRKVDQETVDELRAVFDARDLNGSGTIMREDLTLMAWKRKEYLKFKSEP